MSEKIMEIEKDNEYLLVKCPYCKSLYKIKMETLKKILDKGQTTIPKWIKGRSQ